MKCNKTLPFSRHLAAEGGGCLVLGVLCDVKTGLRLHHLVDGVLDALVLGVFCPPRGLQGSPGSQQGDSCLLCQGGGMNWLLALPATQVEHPRDGWRCS